MKEWFYQRKAMRQYIQHSLLLLAMLLSASLVWANDVSQQHIKVKGTVTDPSGTPLPGVSVVVKDEPTKGVSTDFDGKYEIDLASSGKILIFSYIGFVTKEVTVSNNSQQTINITLQEETQVLDEVVVTALGIKREEKALSYNVQTVKSDDINTVKDANFVNSLSGKVAGVTINRSSSGVGGASKVVMRGAKSIEKSNNALYVIDGVPLYSTSSKQGEGRFRSEGSTEGIADINPEDIESITVLTGASAAALYGSSAANGAILITTKKGKEGRIQVNFSSNTEFAQPFVLPQFQNIYGNDGNIASWGVKLPENQEKYSPRQFFDNSFTFTNSVAVSGGNEKNQTYVSVAATNSNGILPNTLYDRYNFTFRNTTSLLNDKLKIDASANYIIQQNRNMINQGEYMNPLVSAYLLPRGDGLEKAKVFERYNPNRKIYEQVWGIASSNSDGTYAYSYTGDISMQNPYWIAYRNVREMKRERYMISLGISYDIFNWSPIEKWDISSRVRTDNTHYKGNKRYYSSSLVAGTDVSKNGFYGLSNGVEKQTYADILTNITKKISVNGHNLSITANLGASIQDSRKDGAIYEGPLRINGIPNLFNAFNVDQAANKTKAGQEGYIDQTQSVFGSLEVGYNNYMYLTLTGRNDWASQLANSPKSSFFYPSVGLSTIITEMLSDSMREKITPTISLLKIRGAFSSVGSPFERELTSPTYTFDESTKSWNTVAHFPVGALYPEKTDSYEVGIASKWFSNKLTFDLTYYKTNTYNQTIKADISPSSGYNSIYLQTGNVENQGIELGLGYDFQANSFQWNSYFTLGYNKNIIRSLAESYINPITKQPEGKDKLPKGGIGSALYILKTGGTLGDVYTNKDFKRDSDGNIFIDGNGNITTNNFENGEQKIGSVLPDFNLGWRNDFSFGQWGAGFLLSGRTGGIVISMTEAAMDQYGVSAASAKARDEGGVLINGIKYDAQKFYEIRGRDKLAQYYTYSATNFRLQEAYVSYRVPRKALNDYFDLTLSVVGRNLIMIYNKAPFDPEAISSTGNYSQGLDYFMVPNLRSFALSIKANF